MEIENFGGPGSGRYPAGSHEAEADKHLTSAHEKLSESYKPTTHKEVADHLSQAIKHVSQLPKGKNADELTARITKLAHINTTAALGNFDSQHAMGYALSEDNDHPIARRHLDEAQKVLDAGGDFHSGMAHIAAASDYLSQSEVPETHPLHKNVKDMCMKYAKAINEKSGNKMIPTNPSGSLIGLDLTSAPGRNNFLKIFGMWDKLTNISDYEIWRAGKTIDNRTVTEEDLNNVVASFEEFHKDGYEAPLIVGHNKGNSQEKPAVGFIYALKKVGKNLLADVRQIPLNVAEMMRSAFKNRSVEVVTNVRKDGKTYPLLLRAVALLGSTIPAIADMGLPKANPYSGEFEEVMSFEISTNENTKEETLTEAELQAKLNEQKASFEAKIAEQTADLMAKEKEIAEAKGLLDAARQKKTHSDSIARFNSLVKELKVFPTQSQAFVSLYNAIQDKAEKVICYEMKDGKLEASKEEKTLAELFELFINSIPETKAVLQLFEDKMKSETKGVEDPQISNLPADSYAAKSAKEADDIEEYMKKNKLAKNAANHQIAQRAVRKMRAEKENE